MLNYAKIVLLLKNSRLFFVLLVKKESIVFFSTSSCCDSFVAIKVSFLFDFAASCTIRGTGWLARRPPRPWLRRCRPGSTSTTSTASISTSRRARVRDPSPERTWSTLSGSCGSSDRMLSSDSRPTDIRRYNLHFFLAEPLFRQTRVCPIVTSLLTCSVVSYVHSHLSSL